MSTPYIGEVKAFPYNFVPQGWLPCDGTVYNYQKRTELGDLYAVLGNLYGGMASAYTFGVPNLNGRSPTGGAQSKSGNTVGVGISGGTDGNILTGVPQHNHLFTLASAVGNQPSAAGNMVATSIGPSGSYFYAQTASGTLSDKMIGTVGPANPVPVENMQPFMAFNFYIAYVGYFPPHANSEKGDGK
ncbi:MAG: hypothetical protein EP335_16225 [Alphaproteobacteria bacterium]|nr:MAG: hypothetical protein EP335_16225 [Alphaproteobacteria bacterium]